MSVRIDIELVKTLTAQPDSLAPAADSPGFRLYWRKTGLDPNEALTELATPEIKARLLALEEEVQGRSVLGALGRISGTSIEQQVTRHIPDGGAVDSCVEFIPGGKLPFVAEGNTVAVNLFAMELHGNKLYIGDFPLISILANRVHLLASEKFVPGLDNASASPLAVFLVRMLRESCATLFFTVPVSGNIYNLWQQAEKRREEDVELLRKYIQGGKRAADPQELEQHFSLGASAALVARYPLGTWMCQVIEGAFGRNYLVNLLPQAHNFINAFEEARIKFGLPDKFSMVTG
ncbi:MAG TPA: hypothetical protein PKN71_07930 [Bacillota bacterium]|nr:hypothetical protein [Bacillota bacterium]HPZ23085.1 hypothetical protein [Bacillota bacterium]